MAVVVRFKLPALQLILNFVDPSLCEPDGRFLELTVQVELLSQHGLIRVKLIEDLMLAEIYPLPELQPELLGALLLHLTFNVVSGAPGICRLQLRILGLVK